MLGTAVNLSPVDGDWVRISVGTFCYAVAGIVGWPFSVLLGLPMVLEQLFIRGTEVVGKGKSALWAARRAQNMFIALVIGATVAVSFTFSLIVLLLFEILTFRLD